MDFWMILFSVIVILGIASRFICVEWSKYILYIIVFSLWFIASFRYNIGTDYCNYIQSFFELDNLTAVLEGGTELGIALIFLLVNYLGLGFQSFFLICESIIIFFLILGLRRLKLSNNDCVIFFVFYVIIYSTGTYWWSMNVVRQSCAASIMLWGMAFLCEDRLKKFILSVLLASLFHYSALACLLILPIRNKVITLKKALFIVTISFGLAVANVGGKIFVFLLKNVPLYEAKYAGVVSMFSTETIFEGLPSLVLLLLGYVLIAIGLSNSSSKTERFVLLVATVFMGIRCVTSFTFPDDNSVKALALKSIVHRPEAYFIAYYIVGIALSIRARFREKKIINTMVFVTLICLLFLFHSYEHLNQASMSVVAVMSGNPSAGNIDYEFNFDLIKR